MTENEKRSATDLTNGFDTPLHVGQLNLPSVDAFEVAFKGIFARQFFTNHGPLEQELDAALASYFGVRHAVSVVNGTVALMIALQTLDLRGEVIVPAFTFPATVQAIAWAGLTPVFCDVDPHTQTITAPLAAAAITANTVAILGVHVWGRAADPDGLELLARERGLKLVFDAAHAVGCTSRGRLIGGFGDVEAFSFHATKILNGFEGGCITTNDDGLAARIRVARSFHADDDAGASILRLNAKISEAQAAMALLSLDHLDQWTEDNRHRYERYRRELQGIPGLYFIDYCAGERSNYQSVVLRICEEELGMPRDHLLRILESKNILARKYFSPGVHNIPPFCDLSTKELPVTDELCRTLIQLPTGQMVSDRHIAIVCATIRAAVSA